MQISKPEDFVYAQQKKIKLSKHAINCNPEYFFILHSRVSDIYFVTSSTTKCVSSFLRLEFAFDCQKTYLENSTMATWRNRT